jgi:ribosome-associated protein
VVEEIVRNLLIKRGDRVRISSRRMALMARDAALSKRANDPVILEMKSLTPITDYFVITSGTSGVHNRAIADAVEERLDKERIKVDHIEGYEEARWILLDYGDVVVHIFIESLRDFYGLENLWGDAKIIE